MDYLEYDRLDCAFDYLKSKADRKDRDKEVFLDGLKLNADKIVSTARVYNTRGWNTDEEKRICEIPLEAVKTKINAVLTYKQGCSEEQIKSLKGIFLSAEYNLNKAEEKLSSNRKIVEDDFLCSTFGNNSIHDLEMLRLETAKCIKNDENYVLKLSYMMRFGDYITAGVKEIAEAELIVENLEKSILLNLAKGMIKGGCSFSEIMDCIQVDPCTPADPYEVYKLAEELNMPFKLSPDEEELIKKAQKPVSGETPVITESIPEKFNRAYL